MPRSAAFTSGVMQELLRQLEYAPPGTHHRQMDAAEELLEVVETNRLYPEDFITFRITGYRSDRPGPRTSVVGAALRRDLVTFIQCLSWDVELPRTLERGTAEDMDTLAGRLGVSRRTLQRCRQSGLVLHYVRGEDGQRRLACYPDALQRFMTDNPDRLSAAIAFTRISARQRASIIEQATGLAADDAISLNEAARRIALELGRSHEAVRGILRRHEQTLSAPVFREHGPLTRRDAMVIERARRRGIPMETLSDRFGKSVSALHRAMHRYRFDRLLALPLVRRHDRGGVSVDPPPSVSRGLPHHAMLDEQALLAGDAEPDLALLRMDRLAFDELCSDSAKGLIIEHGIPSVEQLDGVETTLRHAAMLHLRMMLQGIPPMRRRVEEHVQQPVPGLPVRERTAVLRLLVDMLDRAILEADPRSGDGIVVEAMRRLDEALESGAIPVRPRRATSRFRPVRGGVASIMLECIAWRWLVPTGSDRDRAASRGAEVERLFIERYGFGGDAPCTLHSLAELHGTSASAIERRLAGA